MFSVFCDSFDGGAGVVLAGLLVRGWFVRLLILRFLLIVIEHCMFRGCFC